MPDRLDQALVDSSLQALPEWTGDTQSISRTVSLTAAQADQLMSSVAESARAMNHDPDIEATEGQLRIVLTTHSAGGVTALDIAMASRINDLVGQATGAPAEHVHHSALEPPEDPGHHSGDDWKRAGSDEEEIRRGLGRMPD